MILAFIHGVYEGTSLRFSFVLALLLPQLRIGVFNALPLLVQGLLLLRPARIAVPRSEPVLGGQCLHRDLDLARAVHVYPGTRVPHGDGARPCRLLDVLQEGRIISQTLRNRIQRLRDLRHVSHLQNILIFL